ncbi:MAG: FtsX-like permease family protein [Clostridiales bacterium]|jgi:putative ABC transport system permease protein|nr:FtsX-like permease family protein [Clostridiales bacterium]
MILENIRLALHNLAANKMRTFLTMLGVIIGIAAVIAILTLGTSTTKQMEKQQAQNGANNISVYVYNASGSDEVYWFTEDQMTKLLDKFADQIEAIGVTNYAAGGKAYTDPAKMDTDYSNCYKMGVNNGYFSTGNVKMVAGKTFSTDALVNGSNVAVISSLMAKRLFNGDNDSAIGKQIIVPNGDDVSNYTVIGVYNYVISSYDLKNGTKEEDISTDLLVPFLNVANAATDEYTQNVTSFTIQATTGADVISMSSDIKDYVTYLFKDKESATIGVYSDKEMIEENKKELQKQTTTTSLIGAIALLVGGIGVMNIMTVTITERTREIGTRKALGAPNSAIRMQFIIEAIVMTSLGGVIGLIVGIIAGGIACKLQSLPLYVPFSSAALAVGVSLAIGIFFGYYPANKAAKMDPIDALRYE